MSTGHPEADGKSLSAFQPATSDLRFLSDMEHVQLKSQVMAMELSLSLSHQ
jgi:hypothetical protein